MFGISIPTVAGFFWIITIGQFYKIFTAVFGCKKKNPTKFGNNFYLEKLFGLNAIDKFLSKDLKMKLMISLKICS